MVGGPVAKSVAARGFTAALAAVCNFAATAITIQAIGPISFGAAATILALVAAVPFMDLGLGAAVTNAAADHEPKHAGRRMLIASRTVLVMSAVVLLFVFLGAALGVWPYITPLEGFSPNQTNMAVVLVGLLFAINAPLSLGARALIGLGLNHIVLLVGGFQSIAALATTGILAISGAPPWTYVCPVLIGQGMVATVNYVLAFKHLKITLRDAKTTILSTGNRSSRATALPAVVSTTATVLALQNDRLILAHLSDGANVAIYALNATFYASAWGLVYTAGISLWPILRHGSPAEARNQRTSATARRYLIGFIACGATLGALFTLTSPYLLRFASGSSVTQPFLVAVAFGLLLFSQSTFIVPSMQLTSERGFRLQAICACLMLICNIPLSMLGAAYLGAAGPALASAISILACQTVPCLMIVRRLNRNHASAQPRPTGEHDAS